MWLPVGNSVGRVNEVTRLWTRLVLR